MSSIGGAPRLATTTGKSSRSSCPTATTRTSIEAQAGQPVRLVFRREDDDACSDRVVFSKPRVDRYLAPRSVTVVDLPAAAGGSIRFTCGMGRYRGRIDLVQGDENARGSRRLTTTTVAWSGSCRC